MNAARAYRELPGVEWTRIDMLLALFDRAVERLEGAVVARKAGEDLTAVNLLARAQVVVGELVGGVNPNYEGAANVLRLYEFVVHAISRQTIDQIEAALQVLCTLREGFRNIRTQAVELEHTGVVPPLYAAHLVRAIA